MRAAEEAAEEGDDVLDGRVRGHEVRVLAQTPRSHLQAHAGNALELAATQGARALLRGMAPRLGAGGMVGGEGKVGGELMCE